MDISSVSNVTSTVAQTTGKTASTKKDTNTTTNSTTSDGVIYEKSSETSSTTNSHKYNAAIVAQLKADQEARTQQLTSIVEQLMSKQGIAIGKADDMWSFLAKGDFTVSADVKAQAQADIADDGYWGVDQTSDRILSFAKALSGGDSSYAEELIAAFKKGYQQATGSWGQELPEISQKTYDAVLEKFDNWVNGTED